MEHTELITEFYSAFAKGDAKKMVECYHRDIVFRDPAFGTLKGTRVSSMWEMLVYRGKGSLEIKFDTIQANSSEGIANWTAEYVYGKKQRKVINHVQSRFKFKEGKIVEHIDTFNLWKWTQQALGIIGYLAGWTPFMKRKIQQTTNRQLDRFIQKK